MGMIIEITEHKLEKMADCVEEMLRIGGHLMSCIDEMQHTGMGYRQNEEGYDRYGMGHRNPNMGDMWDREGYIGMRGGRNIGYRDDEDGEMGERRRRRANGRFY